MSGQITIEPFQTGEACSVLWFLCGHLTRTRGWIRDAGNEEEAVFLEGLDFLAFDLADHPGGSLGIKIKTGILLSVTVIDGVNKDF
jgi:hypothetical protein